uniref:ATP synthase complex subunit 8 n=1 Tax=Tropidostethus angusticollis TaxID=1634175 RepID=A0A7G8LS38_9ORTH|nr:ATP synthase F0 subunit 8 [Tropidostethus angusticollis]
MPQMSPLMWLSLFILFSMTLILFNQMNFFSFKSNYTQSMEQLMIKSTHSIWKW